MKSKEYWKTWTKAAGVRCIKTMAQTGIATIGSSAILSAVDWKVVASSAVVAGILSILTSLAGLPEIKLPEE
uniref:Holin protein n=1 Tax=Dulem virus 36 TaxID=3145754 RepID=A0AAU8AZ09_9CAUD